MMTRGKRIAKRWLAAVLVLCLALGGASGAMAKSHNKHQNGKGPQNKGNSKSQIQLNWNDDWFKKGQGNKKIDITISFKDIGIDMDWAREHIQRLVEQKILEGYTDGTFKPREHVTRLEAIVMAVRLMNLRDLAESEEKKNAHLNFKDNNKIAGWARGYVAVALENDLFSENEDKLNPDGKADRLWVTTLLVKSLGLDGEARARMTEKLPFKDARAIPAGSVGYVAVAIEKGIVKGYTDNTFQPNRKVTRAEIAAFLDRAGNNIPDHMLSQGTLKAEISNNIMMLTNGTVFAVDPGAFVYKNNVRIALSDLKAGDQIRYRTYNNVVIFIEVVASGNSQYTKVEGYLAAGIADNTLAIWVGDALKQYPIGSQAVITRNGVQVQASQLVAGDRITAQLLNEVVVSIAAKSDDAKAVDVKGVLTSAVKNNTLTLLIDGRAKQWSFAANVPVVRNGQTVDASALAPGDLVTVRVLGEQVVSISAQSQQVNVELSGTVAQAVYDNVLSLYSGDGRVHYVIGDDVYILRNNESISASELKQGDDVYAVVRNNTVVLVNVSPEARDTVRVTGTIAAISDDRSTVVIQRNGTDAVYLLDHAARIYRDDKRVAASALKVGDVVFAKALTGHQLTFIQVTEKAEQREFAISGLFHSLTINSQGQVSTISLIQEYSGGTQVTVYNVAADVKITGNPSLLVTGNAVELKGSQFVVKEIIIKEK